MGFPDNYTKISESKKSNRYQALGNSWAVPVIKWIGQRIISKKQKVISSWFPIQSENDVEYHDLSKGFINLCDKEILNCSDKPEKQVIGNI